MLQGNSADLLSARGTPRCSMTAVLIVAPPPQLAIFSYCRMRLSSICTHHMHRSYACSILNTTHFSLSPFVNTLVAFIYFTHIIARPTYIATRACRDALPHTKWLIENVPLTFLDEAFRAATELRPAFIFIAEAISHYRFDASILPTFFMLRPIIRCRRPANASH